MALARHVDAYLGSDRVTRAAIAAWRVASLACGLALVAPIMDVGRRPYRLGRLIDKLMDVRGMEIIPDALPTQLRWLQLTVIATVVSGMALPARYRWAHPAVSAPAFVLAVLVRRGADRSELTTPTTQLMISIILLGIAVVSALLSTVTPRWRPA